MKYNKIKNLKKSFIIHSSLRLYSTVLGILTLEEMIIKNLGGKLLVNIKLNCKNIL